MTRHDVINRLADTRRFFEQPNSWNQCSYVGGPRPPTKPLDVAIREATSCCLSGGVIRACAVVDKSGDWYRVQLGAWDVLFHVAQSIDPSFSVDEYKQTRPAGEGIVLRWNDTPGRTRQDVLDLLDTTICRLQAKGE